MKLVTFVLILAAFLQISVVPVNLLLIILICRAYIKPGMENLVLAFSFGLFSAHLTLVNLGVQALAFLIIIYLVQVFSRTRFSSHSLLVVPLSFILLLFYNLIGSFSAGQSLYLFPRIWIESIVALVIFYIVRMWEERFIVQKEIKLKF